jgi:phosphoribosylanthranilate isomerase
MRIKICGITKLDQALQIVNEGATELGFICVRRSPRFIQIPQIRKIVNGLDTKVNTIGVWVNESIEEIIKTVLETELTSVQLHGDETIEYCEELRSKLPANMELIKVVRVKDRQTLASINNYGDCVDTFLLDAYHPANFGGTGKTLEWEEIREFKFKQPWFLAGGLTPNNIKNALEKLQPDGIDLSSGVEISPGDKDIGKVKELFSQLREILATSCN